MSNVCVPMDPVEPSRENFYSQTKRGGLGKGAVGRQRVGPAMGSLFTAKIDPFFPCASRTFGPSLFLITSGTGTRPGQAGGGAAASTGCLAAARRPPRRLAGACTPMQSPKKVEVSCIVLKRRNTRGLSSEIALEFQSTSRFGPSGRSNTIDSSEPRMSLDQGG